MSKELEALKVLKNLYDDAPFMCDIDGEDVIDIFKKALTLPTADEVCKALSEYLGRKVTYNASSQSFNDLVDGKWMRITIFTGERINIIMYLPPHLITMIGRFYAGLIE